MITILRNVTHDNKSKEINDNQPGKQMIMEELVLHHLQKKQLLISLHQLHSFHALCCSGALNFMLVLQTKNPWQLKSLYKVQILKQQHRKRKLLLLSFSSALLVSLLTKIVCNIGHIFDLWPAVYICCYVLSKCDTASRSHKAWELGLQDEKRLLWLVSYIGWLFNVRHLLFSSQIL